MQQPTYTNRNLIKNTEKHSNHSSRIIGHLKNNYGVIRQIKNIKQSHNKVSQG